MGGAHGLRPNGVPQNGNRSGVRHAFQRQGGRCGRRGQPIAHQHAKRAVVKVQGGFAGLAVTGGAVCAVVCVRQGDPAGSFGGANLHPLRVAGARQRARDGRRQRRQRDNPGRQPDEPAGKATRKAGAAVHERSCQAGSRVGQRAAARNAKKPIRVHFMNPTQPVARQGLAL